MITVEHYKNNELTGRSTFKEMTPDVEKFVVHISSMLRRGEHITVTTWEPAQVDEIHPDLDLIG